MPTGMVFGHRRGRLLSTGQTTSYHVADDGGCRTGLEKVYAVYTVGQHSGTVNLDVPHYASNQISFTAAGNIVADGAAGLVTVRTNDTIVVKGSASNDGVYTVNAGGVAGQFTTNEALADEAAGAYVKLYKRTSHSNNAVWDRRTGRMWSRYTSHMEKVGETSVGLLIWYAATKCYTLHPAAADLQMIAASNTLRIVGGAGEVARYDIGDVLGCSGFVNAVNNLPSYCVRSVTVNGADLDIVLDPTNNVLVDEAAGGVRDIRLECRSIFGYCAAANAVELGGYSDWRTPDVTELESLRNLEAPDALPDALAFPSWHTSYYWSSTYRPSNTTYALRVLFSTGSVSYSTKTGGSYTTLIRG